MTSDLAVIPHDPAALDTVADPAAAMVALVDQARTMLAQASGMEGLADVIEWKSRAEAIRVYTQQKDMGHEAELSAAEIVRRAERRIGQLVREGQEAGEIRVRGEQSRATVTVGGETTNIPKAPASDYLPEGQERRAVYAVTDGVSDDAFEAALRQAKEEGNLSRTNVVRKVAPSTTDKITAAARANPAELPRNLPIAARAEQIRSLVRRNFTSPQIADELGMNVESVRRLARNLDIEITADVVFGGRFRKIDPNRIIDTIIDSATPEPISLARIAYSELDRDRLEEWASSLSDAIRSLTTIKRNLQKELTRGQ